MFATRSLLAAGAPPTLAAGAEFLGTPSVRYEHGTVGVVARFDEAIQSSARAELFTGPSLRRGERIERAFGGNSLGAVGRAATTAMSPRRHGRSRAPRCATARTGRSASAWRESASPTPCA